MADIYPEKTGFDVQKKVDGRVKYPFGTLKVNGFFEFEEAQLARVRSALSSFMRRSFYAKDKKFSIVLREDGKYICGRIL